MPDKTENKKKILLVDDNEIIRIYFREIFWIHGLENKYDLNICQTTEEALKLVKNPKTRPSIIFSGLVMPVVEGKKIVVTSEAGLSLIKTIKSDPDLKKITVVIFSGFSDPKYKTQAMKYGADFFLVKHENMPL